MKTFCGLVCDSADELGSSPSSSRFHLVTRLNTSGHHALPPGASSLSSFDRGGAEVVRGGQMWAEVGRGLLVFLSVPGLPHDASIPARRGQPGSVPQMPPHRWLAAHRALPWPHTPTTSAETAVLCLSQRASSAFHLALPLPPSTDFSLNLFLRENLITQSPK